MSKPKFTVAICGGGLAGVTAAISISHFSSERKDIHVNIYEAVHEFQDIGAGIAMWLRPWKVMKNLGLSKHLRKIADVPEPETKPGLAFELRKSDQPKGVSFYNVVAPFGNLTFHRAELLNCLAEQIDREITTVHFSKRLVSYDLPSTDNKTSPIRLFFSDGTSAECDLLIGADGIHSSTRHRLLELVAQDIEESGLEMSKVQASKLRGMKDHVWSGSFAYRGIISREELIKLNKTHRVLEAGQNYMGKDKHIIAYPIQKGRLVNVVAFCSRPEMEGTPYEGRISKICTQNELVEQFKGWEEEVQHMLQCIKNPSRWAVCTVKGLPTSVHDRVVLIGDAAHAMTPHQGSGAGQAFEDVYILGALIAHPLTTRDTLSTVLKIHESIRLPHANDVMNRSRKSGKLYEFGLPEYAALDKEINDPELLSGLGEAIRDVWKWAWTTDIDDDKTRAINILEKTVGSKVNRSKL